MHQKRNLLPSLIAIQLIATLIVGISPYINHLVGAPLESASSTLLVCGLVLDLLSFLLALLHRLRGHGPSGIPAVGWLLYFAASVATPHPVFLRDNVGAVLVVLKLAEFSLLSLLHFAIHDGFVPAMGSNKSELMPRA